MMVKSGYQKGRGRGINCEVCHAMTNVSQLDTVTTDEQNDKVEANRRSHAFDSAIRFYAIVHGYIPVLARQDLHKQERQRNA